LSMRSASCGSKTGAASTDASSNPSNETVLLEDKLNHAWRNAMRLIWKGRAGGKRIRRIMYWRGKMAKHGRAAQRAGA
jgi:hypothetical protein